jgi:hypothetical protein
LLDRLNVSHVRRNIGDAMTRVFKAAVWSVGGWLFMSVPVLAHHSTAAYDYAKAVDLSGTVSAFQWTNPHMFIHVQVPDATGASSEWDVECGTPNINVRHGWKQSDVKPGEKVTMKIHPMRDGTKAGTLMILTLPNGKILYGPGNDIVAAPPGAGGPGAAGGPKP